MKFINIRTVTIDELKQCSIELLVSICKSLDNGNGDWEDVHESEYDDILQTAIDSVTDYQSDL
jgi:hypothetical protein